MNNESPLIPKGSLLEQKNKGRMRFKIAVFAVLGLHGVAVLALLMAGCNRNTDSTPPVQTTSTIEPRSDTTSPIASSPLPTLESSNTAAVPATNPSGAGVPSSVPTGPISGTPTGATGVVAAPAGTGTVALPPTGPTEPVVAPAGFAADYKVVKNDTLAKIAKHAHVTLASLTNANPGVDSTKLKIGQTIHIPAAPAPAGVNPLAGAPGSLTPGGTPAADSAAGEQVWVVKSGDSLIKIAGQHGIKVKALRAANGLKTDKIRVGQKLKIPAKTATTGAAVPGAAAGATPVPDAGATGSGLTNPLPATH